MEGKGSKADKSQGFGGVKIEKRRERETRGGRWKAWRGGGHSLWICQLP